MNTPPMKHWPEREAFFEWWDERKKIVGLQHDSVIARQAGLDASAPSGWRSGRQRPSAASLRAIAKVLQTTAQEAWARAGQLAPKDLEEMAQAAEPDAWGVEIIRSSQLPADAQEKLIAIFLEQERRDRAERERRLREQIEIITL